MTDTITTPNSLERLTQGQVFQLYLDANVRVGATTSSLIADEGVMFGTSARDWFDYSCGAIDPLDLDLAGEILARLSEESDPLFKLEGLKLYLSNVLSSVVHMAEDFSRLCEATRAPKPELTSDDDADRDAIDEWEDAREYVLPVAEPTRAA